MQRCILTPVLRTCGFSQSSQYGLLVSPEGRSFTSTNDAESYVAHANHHFSHQGKMLLQGIVLPELVGHRNMSPPPLPGQMVPLPRVNHAIPQPRWMRPQDPSGH